jgi:hypothetical protein
MARATYYIARHRLIQMRLYNIILLVGAISFLGCDDSDRNAPDNNSNKRIESPKTNIKKTEIENPKIKPLSFQEILPDKYEQELLKKIVGDFNNNGVVDISIVIRNIETDDLGIAILDGKSREMKFFGAGDTSFGMSDWNFVDEFRTLKKGLLIDFTGEPGIETEGWILPSDGIYMHIDEACGGGLLFWGNEKYNFVGFD